MSWLFSRALVAEYSPVSNSESEPSARLSVMPTQHKFWHNDKMMDHSNLSRFGLTLQLLTESRGEELLTLYRADFPVKTSALQEKAQGSKAKEADSGQRWSELLAKYDPVLFLWKTCQLSLLEDLELSLETWPKWGMTRNGVAYQRQKLEPITSESAFGFYVPTPTASDGTSGSVIGKDDTYYTTKTGMPRKITRHGVDGSVGLGRLVNMWPTPDASQRGARAKDLIINESTVKRRNSGQKRGIDLQTAVKVNHIKWPTPTTSDRYNACMKLTKNGIPHDLEKGNLRGVVRDKEMWLTPTASEVTKIPARANYGQVGLNNHPRLRGYPTRDKSEKSRKFPIPTTRDYKGGYKTESLIREDGKDRSMDALPYAVLDGLGVETKPGYQLSADWVEWLMGFPVGWSDLKAIPGVALSWDREPEGLPRVCEKQEYRALRLKGIGNAQVPQCAAAAFVKLMERIKNE